MMAEGSNPKMEDVEDVEEVEGQDAAPLQKKNEDVVAVGGSSSTTGIAVGAGSSLSFMMGLAAVVVASLSFKMAKDNEDAIDTLKVNAKSDDGNSCITGSFTISSLFNITTEDTFALVGSLLPFSGDVYDVPEGEVIGSNIELCTLLGRNMFQCQVRHMCTRTNAFYLSYPMDTLCLSCANNV
jgi:hypothetical protein